MLERVNAIPWSTLPQPEWNEAGSIPKALVSLSNCASNEEASRAYNRILYALGNNHAGTYYPVVLPALPFLAEIIEHGAEHPREAALDAVIDLVGSFGPEPGFETVVTADSSTADLRTLVHRSICALRPLIHAVERSEGAPSRTRELAREVLDLLDE